MDVVDQIVTDIQQTEDLGLAASACASLDRVATAEHLPALYHLLEARDDNVLRECAAVPIARLDGIRALPHLLSALHIGEEEGHDNDGLESLIIGLVEANELQAGDILNEMISDVSARVRADAAWLWGFVSSNVNAGPLLLAAKDENRDVRAAAVGSLSSFSAVEGVLEAAMAALRDPDVGVQCAAATALGYFRDERAVEPLRWAADCGSDRVRREAARALLRLTECQ